MVYVCRWSALCHGKAMWPPGPGRRVGMEFALRAAHAYGAWHMKSSRHPVATEPVGIGGGAARGGEGGGGAAAFISSLRRPPHSLSVQGGPRGEGRVAAKPPPSSHRLRPSPSSDWRRGRGEGRARSAPPSILAFGCPVHTGGEAGGRGEGRGRGAKRPASPFHLLTPPPLRCFAVPTGEGRRGAPPSHVGLPYVSSVLWSWVAWLSLEDGPLEEDGTEGEA